MFEHILIFVDYCRLALFHGIEVSDPRSVAHMFRQNLAVSFPFLMLQALKPLTDSVVDLKMQTRTPTHNQ